MVKRSLSMLPTWLFAACLVASSAWAGDPDESPADIPQPPTGGGCPVLLDLKCVPNVEQWVIDRPFGISPTKLPGSEISVTRMDVVVRNSVRA